jgi:hypothetical protein
MLPDFPPPVQFIFGRRPRGNLPPRIRADIGHFNARNDFFDSHFGAVGINVRR